jgi:hypothetical protein
MGIRDTTAILSDELLDALAIKLRIHEMVHGDAIAQEREQRRRDRHAVSDNRHERRKREAIERRTR